MELPFSYFDGGGVTILPSTKNWPGCLMIRERQGQEPTVEEISERRAAELWELAQKLHKLIQAESIIEELYRADALFFENGRCTFCRCSAQEAHKPDCVYARIEKWRS